MTLIFIERSKISHVFALSDGYFLAFRKSHHFLLYTDYYIFDVLVFLHLFSDLHRCWHKKICGITFLEREMP